MRRVLVVEDDASVRGLLQALLAAEGYEVSTAADGLAGLIKVHAAPPELVVLDLMMPDLGGLRVLDELHADPRLAAVPVLVVTGRVESIPALAAQLGSDRVLAKPFEVAELLHRVAVLSGGEAERS